jgi:hypothetical protein
MTREQYRRFLACQEREYEAAVLDHEYGRGDGSVNVQALLGRRFWRAPTVPRRPLGT